MIEKKILVVDDEEIIREMLKEAFTKADYAVQIAGSGEEALKTLEADNIQVMFLDLKMGEMDGLELCRRIRKDRPLAFIFAMTGYSSLFDLVECREAGFDDYFIKPINLEIFFNTARDAFEKLNRWKKKHN